MVAKKFPKLTTGTEKTGLQIEDLEGINPKGPRQGSQRQLQALPRTHGLGGALRLTLAKS